MDAWRARLGDDVSSEAMLRAFERAFAAIWLRARVTLAEVTLMAIGDRVLADATELHPILADVRLEPSGISCTDLSRRERTLEVHELEAAVRYVLIELLAVIGRLTGEVLTPPLHAALDDCGEEPSS